MKTITAILALIGVLALAVFVMGCDVVATEALERAKKEAKDKGLQVTISPPTLTITAPSPAPTAEPKSEPAKPNLTTAPAAEIFERHILVTSLLAQLCSFGSSSGRIVNEECLKSAALCVSQLDKQLSLAEMLSKTIQCGLHWEAGK